MSKTPAPSSREISLETRVTIPDHVLAQDLAGEMVVLNLLTGTYFGLDAVGTRLWHLLRQHRQLRPVLRALLDEFEVEEPRCRADLCELVATLRSHGLLQCSESNAP